MKRNRVILIVAVMLTTLTAVAVGIVVWFISGTTSETLVQVAKNRKPNIVILLADDTGYADFQTYGHPTQEWTGVDRMVKEGIKFTSWYVPESICTPSRAALLTGRYPIRSGIYGNQRVFALTSSGGLPKREVTIAEAMKDAGYVTGMVGKWHLGINKKTPTDGAHLPCHHGFDYVGTNIPFTQYWACNPKKYTVSMMRGCMLYQNDSIAEQPINLDTLTSRLLKDTKNFIKKNKENPFFFYLSFPQTHAALFSDPRFAGKSRRGPYGDNVNEMGWAVNEVLDHLIKLQIEKNTLVIFLSDHGPILDGCGAGGTAGVFKGGKYTTWEGGVRVPAVAWWPDTIPPGRISHTTVSSMDLLPTALNIAGYDNYAKERNILLDGKVITDVIKGNTLESPHEILFYYCSDILMAVRYKRYKIHYYTHAEKFEWVEHQGMKCDYSNTTWLLETIDCKKNSKKADPPLIFDVEADPGEQVNLDPISKENRHLLSTVANLVKEHEASIIPVESEINKLGSFRDLAPCCNPPVCSCNYNKSDA